MPRHPNPKSEVFLSHSSRDRAFVLRLAQILKRTKYGIGTAPPTLSPRSNGMMTSVRLSLDVIGSLSC
jgi:hypothetical protein